MTQPPIHSVLYNYSGEQFAEAMRERMANETNPVAREALAMLAAMAPAMHQCRREAIARKATRDHVLNALPSVLQSLTLTETASAFGDDLVAYDVAAKILRHAAKNIETAKRAAGQRQHHHAN